MDLTEVRDLPNPTSHIQLKKWLYELDWNPVTFKVSKNTGKKVPQVSSPFGQGICASVKKLYDREPALRELDGLFVIQHRLGIINAFLEEVDESGRVYASANGFTNTLRLQHKRPIVNLPSVSKAYGTEVRGCLTVPNDDYIMCGSDVSGLEDNTKQHYIYFFDPDYVTQMRVPGFDAHIDVAVVAGLMSKEEAVYYQSFDEIENPTKEQKKEYFRLKDIRHDAKVVNFSAVYGAGPPKMAEALGRSLQEAQALHKTYWSRNKAVKQTARACKVNTIQHQKWLYNPLSHFWMYLKAEKDRFSTLNQSSGVYVFDTWLRNVRRRIHPIKVVLQYHDELLLVCKKEERDFVDQALKDAMEETNKIINLNVSIGVSTSWGSNYAECH